MNSRSVSDSPAGETRREGTRGSEISREWELARSMVSGLAHDLNNQLAPIRMYLSVLRSKLDAGEREVLDLLDRGVRRSSGLVRQMQWILAPEGGVVDCDLGPMLKVLVKELGRNVTGAVDVQLQVADELPPVKADPSRLLHALLSFGRFCREALETQAGTTLRIAAERVAGSSGPVGAEVPPAPAWVRLSFQLPGAGSLGAEIEEMLAPRKVDEDESSLRLNLDLVALTSTLQRYGGGLETERSPGDEAGFRIFLPVVEVVAEPAFDSSAGSEHDPGLILVVDDEPGVRRLTRTLLELFGFRVLLAAGGEDALAKFRQHRQEIRAVLTDLTMPEMSGRELVEELVRIDAATPVVLMTGAREEPGLPAWGDQPLPVLFKPFTGKDLQNALAEALGTAEPSLSPARNSLEP